jgi:hypothetical protein
VTEFELPAIDWGLFEGFERPLAVLCVQIDATKDEIGIVRWSSQSAAELFKDSPHNVVGKTLFDLAPASEHEHIAKNLKAVAEGATPGRIHQTRKYVDRFGSEFEQGLQTFQVREDAWVSFLYPPDKPTDDHTLELLVKAAAALSPASTGSQVINITGQDVSDNRNQSMTAGRDAVGHGVSKGVNGQTLILLAAIAIVGAAIFLAITRNANVDAKVGPDGAGVKIESAEGAR